MKKVNKQNMSKESITVQNGVTHLMAKAPRKGTHQEGKVFINQKHAIVKYAGYGNGLINKTGNINQLLTDKKDENDIKNVKFIIYKTRYEPNARGLSADVLKRLYDILDNPLQNLIFWHTKWRFKGTPNFRKIGEALDISNVTVRMYYYPTEVLRRKCYDVQNHKLRTDEEHRKDKYKRYSVWREQNKDKKRNYDVKWREENAEKRKKYHEEYLKREGVLERKRRTTKEYRQKPENKQKRRLIPLKNKVFCIHCGKSLECSTGAKKRLWRHHDTRRAFCDSNSNTKAQPIITNGGKKDGKS